MNIDLEAKKAWKSKRDKEASAWRTARSAIKEAETPICAPKSEYSAFTMTGCIILALLVLLLVKCGLVNANDITALKPEIINALEGTTATVSTRDYPGFSEADIKAIKQAREELSK